MGETTAEFDEGMDDGMEFAETGGLDPAPIEAEIEEPLDPMPAPVGPN